ncbi:MAG: NPCBM/NEW2 domain-containing protein [Planctomycetota bacterium]
MLLRFVCILLGSFATSVRADVVVTRLQDAEPVRGISLASDGKRMTVQNADGKVVEMRIDEVIEAVSLPIPKPPPENLRPFEVVLLDGSRLRGTLGAGRPDHLLLTSPALARGAQALQVPIEEVLEIRRVAGARVPGASRLVRVPDEDAAYRLDGSRVTGTVESFDEAGVRIDRGDLGARTIPFNQLAALFVENDPGKPTDGLQAVARLHDGSTLVLGDGFRIARGEVTGKLGGGLLVRAPTSHLVSLGFRGGRFEYLSDRAPETVERAPFFPIPEGPSRAVMLDFLCPVRTDASPDGGPIRVQGRRYFKGIGVRPATAITWKLDGSFRALDVAGGIDDEVLGPAYGRGGGTGSVVFRIELDGKEVWNSGIVEGGKAPAPARVELGDARLLTLRVTIVPDAMMPEGRTDTTELDNAVWVRPLLIR